MQFEWDKSSMNINENVIVFFKDKAKNIGVTYQTLINLYLKDFVTKNRDLEVGDLLILGFYHLYTAQTPLEALYRHYLVLLYKKHIKKNNAF